MNINKNHQEKVDVLVLGAGAAGLMCAIHAGKRGRSVIVIDHAKKPAEKIRISGGGRCNFTNIYTTPKSFLSENPHFCTSALKRFTADDFVQMVQNHKIAYHHKTLGQLFCDHSANDIIEMLLTEIKQHGGSVRLETSFSDVTSHQDGQGFIVTTPTNTIHAQSVVVATGGKSIPKMGATGIGYTIAQQFGLTVTDTRPALVPLTFDPSVLQHITPLAGVAVAQATIKSKSGQTFTEALLFTHRGLSGPAILQISSYWNQGESITIDLMPDCPDILTWFKQHRQSSPRISLQTLLNDVLPKRLVAGLPALSSTISAQDLGEKLADLSDKRLIKIGQSLKQWDMTPNGTEGYRTAEVTAGGVCTSQISSKTFEAKAVQGLYFIGEVLDVTGHLGGFNFQWAWSSGWCAGQYV